MDSEVRILGFAGSLRKGSYNRAILRAALEVVPRDARLEVFDLKDIPPFNADFETAMPAPVRDFKAKVKATDAVLIATPEYNYSIPGVLKNAIDWASRPYGDNSFAGKPVAMMSASIGMLGGARAQYHLRQCFVFLDMHELNHPEVFVSFAGQKVDANGNLTDEETKKHIAGLLDALVVWARKVQALRD